MFSAKCALCALLLAAIVLPARAELSEVTVAQQYGVACLPLMLMERDKLVEKHAKAAGLGDVTTSWVKVAGPSVMNDGVITGAIQFIAVGAPSLITLWEKTKDSVGVKGVCAMTTYPLYLNVRNPAIKSIRDFSDKDRIVVPSVSDRDLDQVSRRESQDLQSVPRRAQGSDRHDQQGQAGGGQGLSGAGQGHQEQRRRHSRNDQRLRLRLYPDAAESLQDGGIHEQDRLDQIEARVVERSVLPGGPRLAGRLTRRDSSCANRSGLEAAPDFRAIDSSPPASSPSAAPSISWRWNAWASARLRWRSSASAKMPRWATIRCWSDGWSFCCRC